MEEAIRQSFGAQLIWIIAEISGHKFYPAQDRHYFDFIEKTEGSTDPVAKARGVAWQQGSDSIKDFEKKTNQQFGNGIQILARVKVEFHRAHGFSLVLYEVDASYTLGNLERQRYETLERLVNENPDAITKKGDQYLTRNKSLSFGPVIQNIALIGSPNSEGYTDFMHTLSHNDFKYTFAVDIYQSSVQGAGAEQEIISKLVFIYNSEKSYDCVVIIRGGGARTDFLVFDTYRLSRAVARFPIPVITGLGHHKDVSIVDMMAHSHTKTPTKAAELIISHNRNFEDQILNHQKNLVIRTQQRLSAARQDLNRSQRVISNNSRDLLSKFSENLNTLKQRIVNDSRNNLHQSHRELAIFLRQVSARPGILMAHREADLKHVSAAIKTNSEKYIQKNETALAHFSTLLRMMSPDNVLKKGFAIISLHGRIVSNGQDIKPGDELTVKMAKEEISTIVKSKKQTDGK